MPEEFDPQATPSRRRRRCSGRVDGQKWCGGDVVCNLIFVSAAKMACASHVSQIVENYERNEGVFGRPRWIGLA